MSRIFCILGGIVAMLGGLYLIQLRAVGDASLLQSVANGLGFYCLGKGLFMVAIAVNFNAAVQAIRRS